MDSNKVLFDKERGKFFRLEKVLLDGIDQERHYLLDTKGVLHYSDSIGDVYAENSLICLKEGAYDLDKAVIEENGKLVLTISIDPEEVEEFVGRVIDLKPYSENVQEG